MSHTDRAEFADIDKYAPLWGVWDVDSFIGEGNYGRVYKIKRSEWGKEFVSALKLISIPQVSDYKSMKSFGMSKDHMRVYYEDFVKNITNEIETMDKLKGNSHIVSYEDHRIIEKTDSFGWDILIRMELLEPLENILENSRLSVKEALAVGIDICKALETCAVERIIHRDIKDANIFKNKNGLFKLGDFGISKELSKSGSAASKRGTPLYMAPEVYRGENYDSSVDTYSLGIVLYKLFNKGRTPFLPNYPAALLYTDTEQSIEKRMNGTAMPEPIEGFSEINDIILKACSFNAGDRYESAGHMRQALEQLVAEKPALMDKLLFMDQSLENKESVVATKKQSGTASLFAEEEVVSESGEEAYKNLNKTVSLNPESIVLKPTPPIDINTLVEPEPIIESEEQPKPETTETPKAKPKPYIAVIAIILALVIAGVGGVAYSNYQDTLRFEAAAKAAAEKVAAQRAAEEKAAADKAAAEKAAAEKAAAEKAAADKAAADKAAAEKAAAEKAAADKAAADKAAAQKKPVKKTTSTKPSSSTGGLSK